MTLEIRGDSLFELVEATDQFKNLWNQLQNAKQTGRVVFHRTRTVDVTLEEIEEIQSVLLATFTSNVLETLFRSIGHELTHPDPSWEQIAGEAAQLLANPDIKETWEGISITGESPDYIGDIIQKLFQV